MEYSYRLICHFLFANQCEQNKIVRANNHNILNFEGCFENNLENISMISML